VVWRSRPRWPNVFTGQLYAGVLLAVWVAPGRRRFAILRTYDVPARWLIGPSRPSRRRVRDGGRGAARRPADGRPVGHPLAQLDEPFGPGCRWRDGHLGSGSRADGRQAGRPRHRRRGGRVVGAGGRGPGATRRAVHRRSTRARSSTGAMPTSSSRAYLRHARRARFGLDEIQHIARLAGHPRRARGRRGLEILNRLQKDAPDTGAGHRRRTSRCRRGGRQARRARPDPQPDDPDEHFTLTGWPSSRTSGS